MSCKKLVQERYDIWQDQDLDSCQLMAPPPVILIPTVILRSNMAAPDIDHISLLADRRPLNTRSTCPELLVILAYILLTPVFSI